MHISILWTWQRDRQESSNKPNSRTRGYASSKSLSDQVNYIDQNGWIVVLLYLSRSKSITLRLTNHLIIQTVIHPHLVITLEALGNSTTSSHDLAVRIKVSELLQKNVLTYS